MGLHSFLGVLLVFFYKIYRLRVIAIFVFFVFEVSRGWIVVRYFCFVDNIWSLFARSFALRSLARCCRCVAHLVIARSLCHFVSLSLLSRLLATWSSKSLSRCGCGDRVIFN